MSQTQTARPNPELRDLASLHLREGRQTATPRRGLHAPARVTSTIGCARVVFELGADGVWRMVSIDTYGNDRHVHGLGCDATGYVVRGRDDLAALDRLLEGCDR